MSAFLRTSIESFPEINLETPLYIDGTWRSPLSANGHSDVVDAASEDVVASVPNAGTLDVDAAVAAARTAYEQVPLNVMLLSSARKSPLAPVFLFTRPASHSTCSLLTSDSILWVA